MFEFGCFFKMQVKRVSFFRCEVGDCPKMCGTLPGFVCKNYLGVEKSPVFMWERVGKMCPSLKKS